ncbi:MAG TPA: diacylglycerol kinase family protein [Streptosporangiaceae bacterium]|nr:diacylglycerol kinase family protein [Streptosporangiaceae bacterium]
MRALLIVNPHATSTTRLRRDVIARALSSAVELEVVKTRYRGHATSLAAAARRDGFGLVLTLGGDGTVNEAVNGILGGGAGGGAEADGGAAPGAAAPGGPANGSAADRPALAALPGGNANVFTRAVGMPADPVDAAGQVLQWLADRRYRTIGLGLAGARFFTFNAGLGLDAEVVRAVDGHRARGRTATTALYVRMTVRQYFRVTDRRHPALTLERSGHAPAGPLFLGIVSNTSPWTYLGRRPVYTSPQAAFDTGLDLFALRSLRSVSIVRTLRQMLSADRPPHGRSVLTLHDQGELTLRSVRPVAFQVDGEYMGECECVRFRSVPDALRVIA